MQAACLVASSPTSRSSSNKAASRLRGLTRLTSSSSLSQSSCRIHSSRQMVLQQGPAQQRQQQLRR
jgi:hypothetical protein